jgi:hypothetical protein
LDDGERGKQGAREKGRGSGDDFLGG